MDTKQAIEQLSERDKQIIKLRFEENKDVNYIAKLFKVNEANMEDLITNILAGLRKRLTK